MTRLQTSPDCSCGGTGYVTSDEVADVLLSESPCPECERRWYANHCARCERELLASRCITEDGSWLCEACMMLRKRETAQKDPRDATIERLTLERDLARHDRDELIVQLADAEKRLSIADAQRTRDLSMREELERQLNQYMLAGFDTLTKEPTDEKRSEQTNEALDTSWMVEGFETKR